MALRPPLCYSHWHFDLRSPLVQQRNCSACECVGCNFARVDCLCGMAPDDIHFKSKKDRWRTDSVGEWHTAGLEQLFKGTLRDLARTLENPSAPSPIKVSGSLDAAFRFRDYKHGFARFLAESHRLERLEDRWCIFEKSSGKPIWFCRFGPKDDYLSSIPVYNGWQAVLFNGQRRSIHVEPLRTAS